MVVFWPIIEGEEKFSNRWFDPYIFTGSLAVLKDRATNFVKMILHFGGLLHALGGAKKCSNYFLFCAPDYIFRELDTIYCTISNHPLRYG